MTIARTELSREAASRELLTSLMGVKTWFRETHRALHAEHSPAALLALSILNREGPLRVSDLAEATRLDASVVSRQVSQLEQQGYVERTPDPHDGRAHRLSLTAAGISVLRDGRDRLAGRVDERLDDWSAEEIEAFASRLRLLLERLSD